MAKYTNPTKRHQDIVTAKEAIHDLLSTYSLKEKFDQAQLMAYWEKWMGKTIAERTIKLFIKKKKLYIQLSSAALKHTLVSSKEKMIERVNQDFEVPIIEDVVFL